jgi:choline dehydrogenase-like flavoprotein
VIIDATKFDFADPRTDVCIIGGGAAGLTLAAALADLKIQILVLEAGGSSPADWSDDILKGDASGNHPPPQSHRVCALGGTSLRWGGGCVPLDPIDFEKRSWSPETGWPITHSELAQFYAPAMEAAEAGENTFHSPGPLIEGLGHEDFETRLERFSRPTNFANRWRAVLKSSPNVKVLLRARAVALERGPDLRVSHVIVALKDGRRPRIAAGRFILCLGGLETPRLLLASAADCPEGLGNEYGWVGRGYMCHTAAVTGFVTMNEHTNVGFGHERDAQGVWVRRRLCLSEASQRRHQLLNLAFRLRTQDVSDFNHRDAALSLVHLVKACVGGERDQTRQDSGASGRAIVPHLANVARNPLRVASAITTIAKERLFCDRVAPSIALRAKNNRYALEFHGEQAVNRASRVFLGENTDEIGTRRICIDWRVSDIDVRTVTFAYDMLARNLNQAGVGRLTYDRDKLPEKIISAGAYGGHHIGTTRMSNRPEDGVVDKDCRVHGTENLFIASSSVMPTSGQANPTLTILALAYRLAAHLRQDLTRHR